MASSPLSNVTRAPLRNLVKLLGAAAIVLLAAGNNLANAAENPARIAQEQYACAVVLRLDPSGRRYDACTRSLERSLSEWDYARAVSADRSACAGLASTLVVEFSGRAAVWLRWPSGQVG